MKYLKSRSLYEGVDWNIYLLNQASGDRVALYMRAGIEILILVYAVIYNIVALYMRAGIEIGNGYISIKKNGSRSLYESVDWNDCLITSYAKLVGRSLYESVDWNRFIPTMISKRWSSLSIWERGLKW